METTKDLQANPTAMSINTAVHAWQQQNKTIATLFDKYDAEVYEHEVAPGRNRADYLLGHLIASNDGLLPLLGFGDKLFPELDKYFAPNTEWSYDDYPTLPELKQKWEKLNSTLSVHFDKLPLNGWLGKHTRVSEEDFSVDPLRNKLAVLIGRTIHMGYHLGQLAFLNEKVAI